MSSLTISAAARRSFGLLSPSSSPNPADADDFPMHGLPPLYLRQLINENGGEAAFEGMTTSDVKRTIIVPKTKASALSLCAQLQQQGDARVQTATWFVSHPWQIKFLDLVSALEAFFVDKPNAVIWLDLISTSQHATFDRPPEWWQRTFISAIGALGHMVMVMTPWDNPMCLKRAWCLIELYACRSSGAHFRVALPPSERARFLSEIVERSGAFYDMLSKVNTAKSDCSRDADKDNIFAAVRRLDAGFTGLDRSVLKTVTEWLEQQLEEEIGRAVATERVRDECNLIRALGSLFENKGEYSGALSLYEDCLAKRRRILGDDHPDTLQSLHRVAVLFDRKGQHQRALPLYEDCLAKRRRILGDDHPDTLRSLGSVETFYGDKDEARSRSPSPSLPNHFRCLSANRGY